MKRIVHHLVSILVVEDSSTMRAILGDMLSRLGFQNVDDASSGEEALAKIRARSYTLVISDWHMQTMNGLDLLKAVRLISKPGQNRFMFSTTERTWGSQTSAKIEGAEAFITKPFTIETLKEKIDTILTS